MTGDHAERKQALAGDIRRQFGVASSVRYLRSLPSLQIDETLPTRFNDLLRELDRAEARSARGA